MENKDQTLEEMMTRELGLAALSPEARANIIAGVGEHIMKNTVLAVHERLSPDARKEADASAAAGDREKFLAVLQNAIPDYQLFVENIARETIEDFKRRAGTPVS